MNDPTAAAVSTPPTPAAPKQERGWRLYVRLLRHVRPYRGRLLAGVLALALVSLLEPLITVVFSQIFDRGFAGTGDAGGVVAQSALNRSFLAPLSQALATIPVLWFPLILVGVFALRGVANFVGDFALHWVSSRVVFDLRRAVFAHLLRLPVGYFDRNAAAALTSKINYDTQQVGAATSQALITLVQDALKLVAAIVMMAVVSWRLTLGVFVIAPLVAVVVRFLSKRLRAASVVLQREMGELARQTDEGLSNQRAVKLYAAYALLEQAFTLRANRVRQAIMKQEAANAASSPLTQLVVSFAVAGVVTLAIGEGQRGAMTAGDFFIFFTALLSVLPPVKSLSSINAVVQRGIAAAESVFAVLDEPGEALGPQGAQAGKAPAPGPLRGAIRFESVTLHYPERERPALDGVSLRIEPGQQVAFVGASGSGKSSAMALLAGFYAPQAGQVLVDEVPVPALGLERLRANLSLVAQEVLLVNASVAANIAFGVASEAIDLERVRWAAAAAGAAEFIEALPQGYESMVGEGGGLLSGGQRQRIAIARAFYKNAPVVLLDEATSALDAASEQTVQASLRALGAGHTVVQVAHRLSSIREADVIFVFDQGRLVEQGQHEELLARGGHYAQLVARQT